MLGAGLAGWGCVCVFLVVFSDQRPCMLGAGLAGWASVCVFLVVFSD